MALRRKEVEQAKVAFAKDEAELSKLKSEEKVLKDLVQQLKGMYLLYILFLLWGYLLYILVLRLNTTFLN